MPPDAALENARYAVAEEARQRAEADRAWCNRGWRAMMLAKDLDTCRALLAGESVPVSRLDPEWFLRFGGKRR